MDNQIDRALVFDIWGDYAHFRRFYTTTSPLTFPIPPRTALCGLIGAIIGLEKENNEYLKYFAKDSAFIGLRLLSSVKTSVKKVMIAENLIDTKTARGIGMNLIKNRTQIGFEFLKDPRYRIYFYHRDKTIYDTLKEKLKYHKSVYTPCFGLSENIANFEFIDELGTKVNIPVSDYIKIHSVLPTENIEKQKGINFNIPGEYFSVRLPAEMTTERIITKYSDILFERKGKPIEAKLISRYWTINYKEEENFVFI